VGTNTSLYVINSQRAKYRAKLFALQILFFICLGCSGQVTGQSNSQSNSQSNGLGKSQSTEKALPKAVQQQLDANKIPNSAISIVVKEIATGRELVSHNPTTARNPASSLKLLTTFVALQELGPNYRWKTELFAAGKVQGGVLNGDLYLKGYGDPYLVVEDFWRLLGALKESGLTVINGDLIVDNTHFSVPYSDPGAFDGEPLRLYNVQPDAALINFKAFSFNFTPHEDGKRVVITSDPDIPGLKIINKLTLKKGRCVGYNRGISMKQSPSGNPDEIIFSGQFPSQCRNFSLKRTAMTPSTYLRGMFEKYWGHWGGSISGGVKNGVVPKTLPPIASSTSRPLAEIIRPLNKWSNNVMSRLLVYSLAGTKYPPPYTREQGVEVMFDYFRSNNISVDGLVIDNGSGLSRSSRLSAKFMTDLLRHAHASPLMPEYISSLSLNGIDGTTRRRFRGVAGMGRMHLKTGRLDSVAAIAGYVLAESGKMYTAVVLGNYSNIHEGAGIAIQNALLKWVYQQ